MSYEEIYKMFGPVLEPCPFCGSRSAVQVFTFERDTRIVNPHAPSSTLKEIDFTVMCHQCNYHGPRYPSETEAVAFWNNQKIRKIIEGKLLKQIRYAGYCIKLALHYHCNKERIYGEPSDDFRQHYVCDPDDHEYINMFKYLVDHGEAEYISKYEIVFTQEFNEFD